MEGPVLAAIIARLCPTTNCSIESMTEHADWPEVLKWAEQCAVENLKRKLDTADVLAKEAQQTFTLIVAGAGAALVYAVKAFEPGVANPIVFASAWLCGYLAVVGALLVAGAMMMRAIPASHQEPKNLLLFPQHSICILREAELRNLQARIDETRERNQKTARFINAARCLLLASPLVFVAAAIHRLP